jgi:hypothetical protein
MLGVRGGERVELCYDLAELPRGVAAPGGPVVARPDERALELPIFPASGSVTESA